MVTDAVRTLLREQIAENRLATVIQLLRQAANYSEDSQFLNQLIVLAARFKQNEEGKNTQTITQTEYEIARNQIQHAILNLLNELPEDVFLSEADITLATQAEKEKQKNVGRILYSLPSKMQVKKPERCIIRIAPDTISEAMLKEGVSAKNTTQIETLSRITKVMKVQLQADDPDQFEVVCLNVSEEEKGEQFIDEDSYTEWRYRITALQPGVHNLVLNASIIEVLKEYNNKEVKKSVKVFDKAIEVVSEEVKEVPSGFESGGTIVYGESATRTSGISGSAKMLVPAVMTALFGSYSFAATVTLGTAIALTTAAVGVKIAKPDFQVQHLFKAKTVKVNKVDTVPVVKQDSIVAPAPKVIAVDSQETPVQADEETLAAAHIERLRLNSEDEQDRIKFMNDLVNGKDKLLNKEWVEVCKPALEAWFAYLDKEKVNIYLKTKNDKSIEPTFTKYKKKNPKMAKAWDYILLSEHPKEEKEEIPATNDKRAKEGLNKKNNIANFNKLEKGVEKEVKATADAFREVFGPSLQSKKKKQ